MNTHPTPTALKPYTPTHTAEGVRLTKSERRAINRKAYAKQQAKRAKQGVSVSLPVKTKSPKPKATKKPSKPKATKPVLTSGVLMDMFETFIDGINFEAFAAEPVAVSVPKPKASKPKAAKPKATKPKAVKAAKPKATKAAKPKATKPKASKHTSGKELRRKAGQVRPSSNDRMEARAQTDSLRKQLVRREREIAQMNLDFSVPMNQEAYLEEVCLSDCI
tara:strand:+ start:472 stop:1131 length:660 start_codon:yes stop_codon:yes gene_type:complete